MPPSRSGLSPVTPTIDRLRAHFESIRAAEVARVIGKLSHLSEEDRASVNGLTQAMVVNLLRTPLNRLEHRFADSGADVALARQTEELFCLNPETVEVSADRGVEDPDYSLNGLEDCEFQSWPAKA